MANALPYVGDDGIPEADKSMDLWGSHDKGALGATSRDRTRGGRLDDGI